ncbi:MAG: hypothetical protein AAFZ15_13190 [Bacteroidota bacterium]
MLLFFVYLFIHEAQIAGQCTGPIFLTTQAEVNAFSCVGTFTGDLFVDDAMSGSITDLSTLHTLTSIDGDLFVSDNSALINVDGLSGLTTVTGNLFILRNASLANVGGLWHHQFSFPRNN